MLVLYPLEGRGPGHHTQVLHVGAADNVILSSGVGIFIGQYPHLAMSLLSSTGVTPSLLPPRSAPSRLATQDSGLRSWCIYYYIFTLQSVDYIYNK